MTTADVIAVAIVLLGGLIALRLGLVRVVLGLAGWVGASLATIYGFSYVRPIAREWIGYDLVADVAAGAAIFVVTMIVLTFISHAISDRVRDSAFGVLDRSLGLVAGFVLGAVVVCGAYVFSQQVLEFTDDSAFYRNARTLPLVRAGAQWLIALAPSEWKIHRPAPRPNDSNSTFRELLTPRPDGAPAKEKPGYSDKERDEMDRLIRSHQ